jgi:hypothetical protein
VGIGSPLPKAVLVTAIPRVADFIDSTPSDDFLRDETGARPVLRLLLSCSSSCDVQEASASRAKVEAISTKRWSKWFVAIIGPSSVSL